MRELLIKLSDVLYDFDNSNPLLREVDEALAELAKPEPKPVAWMYKDHLGTYFSNSGNPEHGWLPLYTQPPAQKKYE